VTDIRIFGPNNIDSFPWSGLGDFRAVQHQQYRFFDPEDDWNQRMTIYTGTLPVQHGAGQTSTGMVFEYPLLGIFQPSEQLGILPINDSNIAPIQFRSAVADASASIFLDKDDGRVGVMKVRADLFEIILDQPSTMIRAVVLRGEVISYDTHIYTISFRVSVLERMTENPGAQAPILLGPAWNGNYNITNDGHVGQMVLPGVPQK
jgi:hypothetical protein